MSFGAIARMASRKSPGTVYGTLQVDPFQCSMESPETAHTSLLLVASIAAGRSGAAVATLQVGVCQVTAVVGAASPSRFGTMITVVGIGYDSRYWIWAVYVSDTGEF